LGFACGGGLQPGFDAQVVQQVSRGPDDMLAPLLLRALGEQGLGGRACGDALVAYVQADPAGAAILGTQAILQCGKVCLSPDALKSVGQAADKAELAIQACDARGPDPVFGGDLAALRPRMDTTEYLLVRMAVEQVWALRGPDSEEGKALRDLLPRLAAGMVARNTRVE
jgi:hypothetical protein